MTFSLCVREAFTDDDGIDQHRFGVGVTTRLAGVGTLCPFVNEHGAVATQSVVNVELGQKGVEYLADGLAIEDALDGLLAADEGQPERQLHGVDATGEFAFSGPECGEWFGHQIGDRFTVAGNLLTGESVLTETAKAYEESREEERPLAMRLAGALAAGHAVGGDRRTDLEIQSAAVVVRETIDRESRPFYNDIRVDATETPITDLQTTLERAKQSFEDIRERTEDREGDD